MYVSTVLGIAPTGGHPQMDECLMRKREISSHLSYLYRNGNYLYRILVIVRKIHLVGKGR